MAACLMRSCLPYSRNRLAYPAGCPPGFDPTHVASKNMSPGHGLLAISVPGHPAESARFLNLLKGRPSVSNIGNISFSITAIGPGVTTVGGGANPMSDLNNAAVVDTKQTLAAIFLYNSAHTYNPVFIGSGDVFGSAWYLYVDGTTKQLASYTSAGNLSGIVLNNNEAYFAAASNDGTNVSYIAKSLTTGRVQTATVVGTGAGIAFTSTGAYELLGDDFTNGIAFPVAAVSYTPSYLSPSELLAWSADPWSFWYPRQTQMLVSTEVAAQYAAFSTPQHSLSQVVRRMVGY